MSALDRYLQRLGKQRTETLSPDRFIRLHTAVVSSGGRVLRSRGGRLGSYKITTVEGERYLREDAIVEKHEDIELVISERAKIALLREIDRFRKWKYRKHQAELLRQYAGVPHYCRPARLECGVYVDLRAAYYRIYSRFLFVDYEPGRYFALPEHRPDFTDIEPEKRVRNALFGLLRAETGMKYTATGVELVALRNQLFHPSLCLLTYDILNAIAEEMIEQAGAVYVNTDGYIIPLEKLPEALAIAQRWGFEAKIEAQGETHVVAVGCYRVGQKVSEPYRKNRHMNGIPHMGLKLLAPRRWLFERVRED